MATFKGSIDVDDKRPIAINWAHLLNSLSDTAASYEVIAPGLTIDDSKMLKEGTVHLMIVSGAVAGNIYKATSRLTTTTLGVVLDQTVELEVLEH